MKSLLAFLSAGLVLAAGATPARCDVLLYSQPFDSPAGDAWASQNDTTPGGFGLFAQVYDNFTLAGGGTVNSVQWTGSYFEPPTPGTITAFTVQFYADNGGQPGSLLSTETIIGNANETSIGDFANSNGDVSPFFSYSADLTASFAADAGTQYWVSIYADLPISDEVGFWGWATGTNGDGSAYQDFSDAGPPLVRSQIPVDFAFTLQGDVGSVPEPATLAVFGLMAVGAGCVRRRNKASA